LLMILNTKSITIGDIDVGVESLFYSEMGCKCGEILWIITFFVA